MLSRLFPTRLGTIRDVGFHPDLGSRGAAFVETEHARITLSVDEAKRQFVRPGYRITHLGLVDKCVILNANNVAVATVAVLRHVCKSDKALRQTQAAFPDQCATARREVRACQSLLQFSAALMLLSPLMLAVFCALPAAYLAGAATVHTSFFAASLYLYRGWETVCAELFCEPMIGIELKRVD